MLSRIAISTVDSLHSASAAVTPLPSRLPGADLMTTLVLAARTPRTRILSIVLAVGVLALASQFAVPIPGTPVPLTLQPLVVVLAGLLLGPIDAAVAMLVYLAA